jgi:hypothetical protein
MESAKPKLASVVLRRQDAVIKNAPHQRMRTNAPTSADSRMRPLVARFSVTALEAFRSTTIAADGTRRQPAGCQGGRRGFESLLPLYRISVGRPINCRSCSPAERPSQFAPDHHQDHHL